MKKLEFEAGERACSDCGAEFVPSEFFLAEEIDKEVLCRCPNGCGRHTMAKVAAAADVKIFSNRDATRIHLGADHIESWSDHDYNGKRRLVAFGGDNGWWYNDIFEYCETGMIELW